MKKVIFTLVCLLTVGVMFAQTTPREMVVMEDGTGTWCTYCPGAAMGCDDMLSNGKYVAVIANHNGDIFANTYSNNRNTMWAINGYPTVTFDGIQAVVGGSHTQSMYNSYVPKYNTCMAVSSPLKMEMDVTNSGNAYTAVITLTKSDPISSVNNVLYFFVTQSGITYNWQGQNHLEHVNRLMVPDQNGTQITFPAGNTQTVTLNFTLDAAWPAEDCEFVCFLQNKDAGQGIITSPVKKYACYQGIKQGTIDLFVDFDASKDSVNPGETVAYTNMTTGGYIGVPETYEWIFEGGTPATSTDENPVVMYNGPCGDYNTTLIVNRGGQIDTLTWENAIYVFPGVGISESNSSEIKVSPNPNHGTFNLTFNVAKTFVADLKVLNSAGKTVYSESNVTISNDMTKTIRTTGLPAGEYFLTIQNGENKLVKKILVN